MPSLTGVEQPVCSFGMPSTSTRHMRQAPTGRAELGLVAEDRDLDVAVLGGVDQHRVLGRGDLEAVDA